MHAPSASGTYRNSLSLIESRRLLAHSFRLAFAVVRLLLLLLLWWRGITAPDHY
jgi:hypothetical protein